MTDERVTDYQRVAGGILGKIRSGDWPVGEVIPSTPKLATLYGVSPQPVRKAVGQLQRDGVLKGHPGKGVYVAAMPEAAAAGMRDIRALGEQVADLKRRVAGDSDLRERVERIEASLMEIYARLGWDRPGQQPGGNGREASSEQAG